MKTLLIEQVEKPAQPYLSESGGKKKTRVARNEEGDIGKHSRGVWWTFCKLEVLILREQRDRTQ
jgi:hypothetical protein